MHKFEVDALLALLIAESALIFFILTIVLYIKCRKLKKQLKQVTVVNKETVDKQFTPDDTKQIYSLPQPQTDEIPKTADKTDIDEQPSDTQPNNTSFSQKLNKIINFQKNKIAELMGYKDLFENAQKKLNHIQNTYVDLQTRLTELSTDNQIDDLQVSIMSFEANNNELKNFITVLEQENNKLSEQFIAWENKLAKVWRESETSGTIDDTKYNELLSENENLVNQIKEFEAKLHENMKIIAEMQKQYEDLETEYMTLYRQQHGG